MMGANFDLKYLSYFYINFQNSSNSCSKFQGLLKKGQKFLCMCSRTRENDKNKVKSDFWDTLYKGSPDKCCAVCAWGNTDAVLEINTKMGRDEPRLIDI